MTTLVDLEEEMLILNNLRVIWFIHLLNKPLNFVAKMSREQQ